MSTDPASSDAPFGEINIPKKKQSPFSVASETKSAGAAASVRASLTDSDQNFAAPPVQRIRTPQQAASEPLGDLPDVDDTCSASLHFSPDSA